MKDNAERMQGRQAKDEMECSGVHPSAHQMFVRIIESLRAVQYNGWEIGQHQAGAACKATHVSEMVPQQASEGPASLVPLSLPSVL